MLDFRLFLEAYASAAASANSTSLVTVSCKAGAFVPAVAV